MRIKHPVFVLSVLVAILFTVRYLRPKVEPPRPPSPIIPIASDREIDYLVASTNKHTGLIRSLVCDDVQIKLSDRFLGRFKASLNFEKPHNMRLVVSSLVGQELDIGSNMRYFWFWSRRMQPPGLYYSLHENLANTRLKTPFHPVWMMSALGLDAVDLKGATVGRDGDLYQIRRPARGPSGQPVTRITVIDPKLKMIVGEHIMENGRLVASSEIREHHSFGGGLSNGEHFLLIPQNIVMHWYEEDITLEWTLERCKINSQISPARWQLPASRPRYDIGVELQ